MAVTAALIKELREMTGAGMMDCKKALDSTNGNIEEAILWLRENGLAKAAKKADRVAAEGVAMAKENDKKVVIFEVNSETDFVSQNEKFMILIDRIADTLLNNNFSTVEDAKILKMDDGMTIEEATKEATSTIGEKIELRRVDFINKVNSTSLYNHANKRISVAIEFDGKIDHENAYNLAMHVAAMAPKYLTVNDVPQDFIDQEMKILKETTELSEAQMKNADKIFEGKINKRLSDVVLLLQGFVVDDKVKVEQFLKNNGVNITKMVRFEVGEGIEKVETDFAAEVAAQLGGN